MIDRRTIATLACVLAVAAAVRAAGHTRPTDGPTVQAAVSLKAGVYSDAQAARGKALYQSHCATCHLDLRHATPPLAGEAFRAKWASLTVNDLFTKMKETMPTVEPGMLTPAEYIDLVAFILNENKAPAGTNELKADGALLEGLTLGDLPHAVP